MVQNSHEQLAGCLDSISDLLHKLPLKIIPFITYLCKNNKIPYKSENTYKGFCVKIKLISSYYAEIVAPLPSSLSAVEELPITAQSNANVTVKSTS